VVFLVENKNQKKRKKAEAQNCDLVGNSPDAAFHRGTG
jgi:hypothetical protein